MFRNHKNALQEVFNKIVVVFTYNVETGDLPEVDYHH